jgi:DNA-binding transcriptional LysR family regulator
MSNSAALGAVDLNLLVALDLLLDERSVRGAARRAGVTPSAMSHTLARLRQTFDDALLVRSGAAMVPTRRAEALAEPVRHVLALARDLLDDGAPIDPRALRRAFRLVCTDHVAAVLLPAVDQRLRREAPGVDLYVLPLVPETMDDLRRGAVDAAIGIFPEAPPELRTRRLFEDAFVTVARRDHPRVRGPALSLDAFLAESHALVAPRGGPRGTVDEQLAARGLARRVARTFPSFLAAMWHVAGSEDLLTISARLVGALGPTLGLAAWAPPLELPGYAMHLAWHPRADRSREDAWLRGVLVEAAAALPSPTLSGATP